MELLYLFLQFGIYGVALSRSVSTPLTDARLHSHISPRQIPPSILGQLGSLMGGGSFGSGGVISFGAKGLTAPPNPARVETLEPKIQKSATRKRLLYGPFNFAPADPNKSGGHGSGIPGAQMDPNGQVIGQTVNGFCSDCTVLHGTVYVANEDGTRADLDAGAYLHHLVFANLAQREPTFFTCSKNGEPPKPPSMPANYFLGAGVDQSEYFFSSQDQSVKSGYYLGNRPMWVMQAEVVNYNKNPMRWYIAADYEYVPGKIAGAAEVQVTDINVNGCSAFLNPGYMPPKGQAKVNMTSPNFILQKDGTIIQSMGHMHDGGVNVILKLNGKEICDSKASYGGKQGTLLNDDGSKWETIASMTYCRNAVPFKKGDVITMESYYDTDLHPLRHAGSGEEMEEMGIFTIFFTEKLRS